MTIAKLISKYEITDADVDIIHNELLLPSGTLENCFQKLNQKLDKRKIFNVAKALATSEYGLEVSDLNQSFDDERSELDIDRRSTTQDIKIDKEIGRHLSSVTDEILMTKMERKLEEMIDS